MKAIFHQRGRRECLSQHPLLALSFYVFPFQLLIGHWAYIYSGAFFLWQSWNIQLTFLGQEAVKFIFLCVVIPVFWTIYFRLLSNTVIRVKIIQSPALTVPPTSTWNITFTPPLLPLLEWRVILNRVSQASKVFDLLVIESQSLPVGFVLWINSAGYCSAGPPLCWGAAEVWGDFSAGERELINLTVERHHRCAGIKADRALILMREGRGGGLLLYLASCLSVEKGSGVKRRDWRNT